MATPVVALEEHFSSAHVPDPFRSKMPEELLHRLLDLEHERIERMDAGQIGIQVISHATTPGKEETPEMCRLVNNELASAVEHSGGRFAGFALLPMLYTEAAIAELERAVTKLGFHGALIGNTIAGIYLDSPRFGPIFEKAVELDVPIYIHPTSQQPDIRDKMFSGAYTDAVTSELSTRMWGWHADTGLTILKMYSARVFDRIPDLKVIIGHAGEMLPYMLDRITHYSETAYSPGLERSLRDVFDKNIWITTSGMFSLAPMACLVQQIRPDRLMYSVDYPFSSNEEGLNFLYELQESGLMSSEEFDMFKGGNAVELLGLDVSRFEEEDQSESESESESEPGAEAGRDEREIEYEESDDASDSMSAPGQGSARL